MNQKEFFNLANCKQGGPFCVPFSYGIAIYHVTGIHPQGMVCLYCILSQCGFFDNIRSDYEKIMRMHIANLSSFHDKILGIVKKTNLFNEQNLVTFIQKYTNAKKKIYIEQPVGDNFLSVCENKLRITCYSTAMLCINYQYNKKVHAHSVAVMYDVNDGKFIMKDPNNCKFVGKDTLEDLKSEIFEPMGINFRDVTSSNIGSALFFSKELDPNDIPSLIPCGQDIRDFLGFINHNF